jgi:hypothetical protein
MNEENGSKEEFSGLICKCPKGKYHIHFDNFSVHLPREQFLTLAMGMFQMVAGNERPMFEEWTNETDWQRLRECVLLTREGN